MPSFLVGAQSGGVPFIGAADPYSGRVQYPTAVLVRLSAAVSGLAFVGASGNLTIASGGGLSSGGLRDAMELAAGNERIVPIPGSLTNLYATCVAGLSGTMRIFWTAQGPGSAQW